LDRNEVGALLVAAGLASTRDHALISLLALNGLRVSEATGADIEALGLERGHAGEAIEAVHDQTSGDTAFEGVEDVEESDAGLDAVRSGHAFVAMPGDNAVLLGVCPDADRVFLDLEAEAFFGLAVGADTEVRGEVHDEIGAVLWRFGRRQPSERSS
jgi:hypothetical protein